MYHAEKNNNNKPVYWSLLISNIGQQQEKSNHNYEMSIIIMANTTGFWLIRLFFFFFNPISSLSLFDHRILWLLLFLPKLLSIIISQSITTLNEFSTITNLYYSCSPKRLTMNEWVETRRKKKFNQMEPQKKFLNLRKKMLIIIISNMIIIWCLPTAVCLFGYDYFWWIEIKKKITQSKAKKN